jgi:hypothetical protein
MKYSDLFNLANDDGPYLRELISKAADKLNAAPAVPEADFKKALADYTTLDKGTLTVDIDKMGAKPASAEQFHQRLGLLFDGLAERGGMIDGQKVTIKVPQPPKEAALKPKA